MTTNPSLQWQSLQNVFYHLRPCYDHLNWPIENLPTSHNYSLSPYGTLVAISSKFVPHANLIEVYSTSGNKIFSIIYNSTPQDHILGFQFYEENLCVLLNNCRYRLYNDFKLNFTEYNFTENLIALDNISSPNQNNDSDNVSLTTELQNFSTKQILNLENMQSEEVLTVLQWKVHKNYLCVALDNKIIIADLISHQNYQIPFNFSKIHSLSVLGHEPITILVCHEITVLSFQIDLQMLTYEIIDNKLTDGPFNFISLSQNESLVALYNNTTSRIYVVNKKFDQIVLQYDISDGLSPYQMEWCGNDAIILALRDELRLVGPAQQSISFFYDVVEDEFDLDLMLNNNTNMSFTIPVLLSQPDGMKVITNNRMEFLCRVSEEAINVYQIGSTHPSSILLDCINKQAQHASKADTSMSLLIADNSLELAIEECLIVALEEFNLYWQKKILRAVSFGKAYCDNGYNADNYLRTINYLKVLNQLRSPDIGLFLTYKEIESMEWEILIEMLVKRDHYLLALKIIELLNINKYRDTVFIYWCCYKIKKELDLSDIELFKIVAKKLISSTESKTNYISVDKILEAAHEEGRINLCKMLINLEPSINRKISHYLRFEELEVALINSLRTCDTCLTQVVLLFLQDTLSLSQFFKVLSQNERKDTTASDYIEELKQMGIDIVTDIVPVTGEVISNFWINNIGIHDPLKLEHYYTQVDKKNELSLRQLKEFIKDENQTDSDSYVGDYKAKLTSLINKSNDKKKTKILQREVDILELQKKLSETYITSFYDDKSIVQILHHLITLHQTKQASKIVKDFHISQEKYWYLVLNTYCKMKEFDKLHKFVFKTSSTTNIKSPIGFLPFIKAGFKFEAPQDHISDYIRNYTGVSYGERINLYLKNNDMKSATLEAFLNKDVNRLKQMLQESEHEDEETVSLIKGYITKLGH